MKKILGLAVLMMVMLVSISGLADEVPTSVDIPVYLNVPEFVKLSVVTAGDQFDLTLDPASGEVTPDTVTLLAEANVGYTIKYEVAYEALIVEVDGEGETITSWDGLVGIKINDVDVGEVLFTGSEGLTHHDVTATLQVNDFEGVLKQGAITSTQGTHIADVTFTISSL